MRRVRIPGHEGERTCTRCDDGTYLFEKYTPGTPGSIIVDAWTLTPIEWCDLLIKMVPGIETLSITDRASIRDTIERIFSGRFLRKAANSE